MNGKVTQEEINKVVWQACDTFRGVIDPSQYKDYILTMLFLKYVSDVSKAKYKEYLQRYDGDTERAQRAMRRERFQVPEKSSFDYLFEHRNESNIGELIDIALADLEFANREKLSSEDGSGIFRNISFNSSNLGETKERNARLKQLLIDFSDERLQFDESHLENNDVIGDAYMFLIEKFASDAGKKAGEFFTPKEVSTLLARLTKSAPGSRICDPTCGSGSLLIKAGREVGSDNFSLYGQELNGSTWALAMMNMLLHGFDSATIRWGDTLRNPKLKEGDALMKFDTVVVETFAVFAIVLILILPFMAACSPGISHATYITGISYTLPGDLSELAEFIRKESGLYVCDGREYGNGYGFLRMNLACRRELLKEGLERLKRSIHSYRKGISNGII